MQDSMKNTAENTTMKLPSLTFLPTEMAAIIPDATMMTAILDQYNLVLDFALTVVAGSFSYKSIDSSQTIKICIMTIQNPFIILGSSRGDGNTRKAIQQVIGERPATIIDLKEFSISHFDYKGENQHDDFISIAEQMSTSSTIILATPVYWYTMSAIMKTFIDRFSEMITNRKDLGRKLKGKKLYVITSFAGQIPESFEAPFSQICAYFEIDYKGCYYFYTGINETEKEKNIINAKEFAKKIWEI